MIRSLTLALGGGAVALGIALGLTTPASDAAAKGRGMSACRVDAATFCGNVEAGRGARMKCLIGNINKLQATCATAVEARLADRAERRAGAAAPPPRTLADSASERRGDAPMAAEDDEDAMSPAPTGRRLSDSPALERRTTTETERLPSVATPDHPFAGPRTAEPLPRMSAAGQREGRGGDRPMRACSADMQSHCAGVEAGGGARMRCLAENQTKLSPGCTAALATIAKRHVEARAACKTEAQALCANARGPERRQCLTTNIDRVSQACASTLRGARDGQRG